MQIATGSYVKEKDITFKDFSSTWLESYAKTVKVNSYRSRVYQVNVMLKHFSHLKMKDITALSYQKFLTFLHDDGYSRSTQAGTHITGRMIFKKALELKIIKSDPTEYAKLSKKIETIEDIDQQKESLKYLEKSELINFLQVAKTSQPEDYLIFTALAYGGMRIGELLALKWTDVDF